jgi:serine protease Do
MSPVLTLARGHSRHPGMCKTDSGISQIVGTADGSPGRGGGRRLWSCLLPVIVACATMVRASDLPALWAERVKCAVAIEYTTETEVERRQNTSMGTVIDTHGTIILPSGAIDPRTPVWQLKDFKVYQPGSGDGMPGEYLGQDAFTGWHFVRAHESVRGQLTPMTAFVAKGEPRGPALAEFLWGVGLRTKDEDFMPYYLQSHLALVQRLPQRTGIAQQEVAAPGLPVFDREGRLVGLALASFAQSFVQFSRTSRGTAVLLINVEESSAFLTAEEVLPHLGRIPRDPSGRPLAWLGAHGLGPMEREVAKFLNLSEQGGVVVSEVLEGSPAEKAGLQNRDIIIALDGRPLPQFKPERVIVTFMEREVDRRAPGDELGITVLRGTQRVELRAVLTEEPRLMREAERKYFDRLGFTAREFVYGDGILRRVNPTEPSGVVAHYIKPSSPAGVAGLREDDWIREIDGVETKTFAEAVAKLAEIERDESRPEFVMLVSRGGETAVLRAKLR